jgi:hypothetical protein
MAVRPRLAAVHPIDGLTPISKTLSLFCGKARTPWEARRDTGGLT